jgi:hypothetical protein
MEPVYTPASEVELRLLMALLEAEGIPCFIRNEHFGSLYPGPVHLEGINARTLMVPAAHASAARALIGAHLGLDGTLIA